MTDNAAVRLVRRFDAFQQRTGPLAFVVAVNKKFGDDLGGSLAAQLTYYGFLSIFPLLLVLITVLGMVIGGNEDLINRIVNSATRQFPVLGTDLGDTIRALHRNSPVSLTVGLAGLLWGALGSVQAGQYVMAQVWNIPRADRPGFGPRVVRSLAVLGVFAVFLVVSSGLGALAGVTGLSGNAAVVGRVAVLLLSTAVNAGLMVGVFRALTPKEIGTRDLVPGAALAGVAWTVLQLLGGLLIGHVVTRMTPVYGTFTVVLGLLWWIAVVVRIVLYGAEVNVVRARRLWPRALAPPPLTTVDRQMLVTYARQAQIRPEVEVSAQVDEPEPV